MGSGPVVPSLSDSGWISDNKSRMDYLLSYFYESQYSQTQFYYGNITSMSYILYQYGNNPTAMANEVESALTTYLTRYLSSVIVECSANVTDSISASINIYIQFNDDNGSPVTFSNMLLVSNNKIVKIVNANNTGVISTAPI